MRVRGDVTLDDLRSIIDYYAAKDAWIPVDCEHAVARLADAAGVEEAELLDLSALLAEKAAAGMASLHLRGETLVARFERWSKRARKLFGEDAIYCYFSPVFRGLQTPPLRITSIALTNNPALDHLNSLAATASEGGGRLRIASLDVARTAGEPPANHKHKPQENRRMKNALARIARILGMDAAQLTDAETPDLDRVADRIETLAAAPKSFVAQVAPALHCSAEAPLETVAGLVLALGEKAAADAASLTDLSTRISQVEAAEKSRYIDSLQGEGRITAAMRPWAEKQDMAALRDFAASAPVIIPGGRALAADGGAASQGDTLMLSEATRRVAAACGFSAAQVAKANGLKLVAAALALLVCMAPLASTAAPATADRNTVERPGRSFSLTVKDAEVIYAGTMVSRDSSGEALNAGDTASTVVMGIAAEKVDNTDDGESVTILRGVFRMVNGDTFTVADIGEFGYVADNQTIVKAATATNDIIAGLVVDVDASGVWIDFAGVGEQGATSLASLAVAGNAAVTGNATVGGTLGVTGVATFTAESVHNLGIDADYITTDAAAGIDTKTAGTLKVGEATATKVEIADTGVETEIQGTLDAQEAATFASTVGITGVLTLTAAPKLTAVTTAGAQTVALTNAPAAGDAIWANIAVGATTYVIPLFPAE
jgi:phage I-like protein